MIWLLIVAAAIVIIAILKHRHGKKSAEQSRLAAERIFQERDRARAERVDLALEAARRLPVLDRASSPLLHEPIFDSMSGFELPCAHPNFEGGGTNVHNIGLLESREEMEETVKGYAGMSFDAGVSVDAGDHLIFVWTSNLRDPGGMVWQLVRTGEEEWFGYYWRAGLSTTEAVDPTFWIKDLIQDPLAWIRREVEVRELISSRSAHVVRRCKHRI